ncbi:dUTP diphosphatase [Anaerotalea alkaliphila]|uniref:dUTP diphosphatase n=1 Tax=Anaerotalea alkaliphila TaxID=2662126 RepID=A0A7X5KP42_9FIRM|nr:dUTP diphosphatase [Anaerotalea alkaliphila]NDL68508.1 dUTP diphosphatase [Anaerotalea alkaliphila]
MKVKIINSSSFELPSYGSAGAAGMDLRSEVDVVLWPGLTEVVGTGIRIQLPKGYEAQIRSRSGLASRGICVANSPGTIDEDYRGEIKVILINHTNRCHKVFAGDRIAQLVVAPVTRVEWVKVETLDDTERAAGGLGSTGVR